MFALHPLPDIYQFNGDIIANLPKSDELTDFSVILIKFEVPIEEIEVWDADASMIDAEGLYWIFAPKFREKFRGCDIL